MTAATQRIDPDSGVTETFMFFGDGPHRIAGVTHVPPGEAQSAVLICPGVLQDFMKNYRTDVILSRTLAALGIAVQRFQYRGTGNSDGPADMISFETMCDDVRTATTRLQDATGHPPATVISSRMGCLVAAACSSRMDGPSLVFFEPVLVASRYYREGFRARMVSTVTEAGKQRMSGDEMVDELTDKGLVDMVGFSLTKGLYESTVDLTLPAAIEAHRGNTLLVQLSEASAAPNGRFVHAQSELGRQIETLALDVGEAWWFIEDGRVPDAQRAARDAATNAVADWVVADIQGRA